jgi:DNA mismatch repair ATPase MutS
MSDAICKADSNSVIIIDEFGKGTMTVNLWLLIQSISTFLGSRTFALGKLLELLA